MPEYSFRVRATDSSGAFADRDFSINVRNTLVDRFIATDSTNAYTSTDGLTWTTRTNQGATNEISNVVAGSPVAQGGGLWMVFNAGNVRSTNSVFGYRTSPDGVNWTQRTFSLSGVTLSGIKPIPYWVNNRWMIFGTASAGGPATFVATSTDGINWTVANSSPTTLSMLNIGNVIFANGRYVASYGNWGSPGSVIGYTSTDLSGAWTTLLQTGLTGSWAIHDPLFINGVWYFLDANTITNARVLTTTNLTSYTPRIITASYFANQRPGRLIYGNGRLIALPAKTDVSAVTSFTACHTSDDGGITWTQRNFGTPFPNMTAANVGFLNGTFFNGTFYVWGSGTNATGGLRTSRDGITWSQPTLTGFSGAAISGFARMALA